LVLGDQIIIFNHDLSQLLVWLFHSNKSAFLKPFKEEYFYIHNTRGCSGISATKIKQVSNLKLKFVACNMDIEINLSKACIFKFQKFKIGAYLKDKTLIDLV
jgi:hypothetical protein